MANECKENFFNELTEDYLRERLSDMRVGQVAFALGCLEKGRPNFLPAYSVFPEVDMDPKSSFYRSLLINGQTLKREDYPKLFKYFDSHFLRNSRYVAADTITLPKLHYYSDVSNRKGMGVAVLSDGSGSLAKGFPIRLNLICMGWGKESDSPSEVFNTTSIEAEEDYYFLHPPYRYEKSEFRIRYNSGGTDRVEVIQERGQKTINAANANISGVWRLFF